MATVKLSIHIPPDSNPTNVVQLTADLSRNPDARFESSSELLDYLSATGVGSRIEIVATASSMGILQKTERGIQLSANGMALARLRDEARGDLLHFFMYTGWSPEAPTDFLQSWAYRLVCDQYWELGDIDLTGEYLDRQVAEVISLAHAEFGQMDIGAFQEVSFSRKSLRGAHNWLEAVTPPVITDRRFTRRSFCPPELLVMAIGHVLGAEDNVIGLDVLLTPEKREAISRICLLDITAFDRALDWAMSIFPHIITPGTSAGFYGRFIRLHRLPRLQDVVR